jgi:hypothetical protein
LARVPYARVSIAFNFFFSISSFGLIVAPSSPAVDLLKPG